MIDVNDESLVTFAQLARRLPHRRNGRPTHVSTIHRWRAAGVNGVRLDAVRMGGAWVTSLEAYSRFCAALTAKADAGAVPTLRPAHERVGGRLDEIGI